MEVIYFSEASVHIGLHESTAHKMAIFITTAVITSNPIAKAVLSGYVGLLLNSEDRGSMLLRNVNELVLDYMVSLTDVFWDSAPCDFS
jgi:hypothetical protein